MSGIEELRERVIAAEQRFGLIGEQQAHYSDRLIGLMDELEGRMRAQQELIELQGATIAQHDAQVADDRAELERLHRENDEVRAMLHSLLGAIETGGRDRLLTTMQTLDQKISSLIGAPEAAAPDAGEQEHVAPTFTQAEESGRDDAWESAEGEAGDQADNEADDAETSLNEIMRRVSRLVEGGAGTRTGRPVEMPPAAPRFEDDPAAVAEIGSDDGESGFGEDDSGDKIAQG